MSEQTFKIDVRLSVDASVHITAPDIETAIDKAADMDGMDVLEDAFVRFLKPLRAVVYSADVTLAEAG